MKADGRWGGPVRLPPHAPGMRIGLYGGTFDPPHPGHRHVASMGLKRLGLDRVWWLVSPGNPLKDRSHLPSSQQRREAAESIARHPRMVVTDFETELGSRYTVDTLAFLRRRCPGVSFVLIVGADSFANFHRWRAWQQLAGKVPIAVVDRPGWTLRAANSPAARRFADRQIAESRARLLPQSPRPAWTFLHGPRSNLSSTALRDRLLKRLDNR